MTSVILTKEKNVHGRFIKTQFASNSSSAGLWEEILLHTCGASLQNVHFQISHRALDDLLILCSNLCNRMSYKTLLSGLPGGYLYMRNTSLIVAGKTALDPGLDMGLEAALEAWRDILSLTFLFRNIFYLLPKWHSQTVPLILCTSQQG